MKIPQFINLLNESGLIAMSSNRCYNVVIPRDILKHMGCCFFFIYRTPGINLGSAF